MGAEVRTITSDERDAWVEAVWSGFLNAGPANRNDADVVAASADLDHTWAAVDDGRIVGTLRSFATPVSVPGGLDIAATGLTAVTVAATHRRQGLLTEMITSDLAACAARGDAVSVLIAAEYPIYGRYGYGPAAESVELTLDATTVAFTADRDGSVELVGREAFRAAAPDVYDRFRVHQPGAIARDPWWWDLRLGSGDSEANDPSSWLALSRDESGAVDGFVAYRVKDRWEHGRPRGRLQVDNLIGVDTQATVRLWRYCAEIDWVGSVVAGDRTVADPVAWHMADARALAQHDRTDMFWLRILDVPAALGVRRYLCDDRLVLEVDDALGHGHGRFALDAGPGHATCVPTSEAADLALSVSTLSSAYLGGYTLAEMARGGRLSERSPDAVGRADAMFRSSVAAWSPTHF